MAHILQHWRYHLNEWVVEYLIQQGYCTPEQLIERDRMNDRKRQRCAEKIVDEMEGSGKIKRLYKDYKDQIKLAQEAKHDGSKKYIKR
jgi:aerobic-type carbon monoxide dehydrogenase small subunit (CoxS/CutS family)